MSKKFEDYNLQMYKDGTWREKHIEFFKEEVKKILGDSFMTTDLKADCGDELEDIIMAFADIYNGRYGHKYDPHMDYKAAALPLFFIYGYLLGQDK